MQAPETIIPAHGDAGIPSFQTESMGGTPTLLHGDKQVTTGAEKVGQNTNLPAYAVVARDGADNLKLAVQGTDTPVGITVAPVVTGAGVSTNVDVFKSGHFNADALTWDASYNIDLEKTRAFEGSKAPEIQISFNRFKPLV